MEDKIKAWLKTENKWLVVFLILIGFELGDILNDFILTVFNIDSFIISLIVGTSSLILPFFLGFLWHEKINK
ncbi:hypothetical protein DOK76_07875 [Vagococcus sp. DIV0080]|uniref:Uncharacterized protein n=1 Tax=Candidatus Vagococcus giribetii TaxID=2230876 RepID=A0ABS3HTA6_9ENTE|nr:hypothetical protein [Vagococcus sp. DIV0080]MBO0476984.1 hypothetical protein [Vagococcus sp. DIV0080]